MALSDLPHGKLYVQIAHAIRAMVEEGRFAPGDKLPTLAELAATFSCSRATVREALSALRGQGLVEFRHGDGTYIRTASLEMWMEPLEAAVLLGTGQIRQLLELMTALLAGAASLAAEHASDLDLGPVRSALFQLECAGRTGEDSVAAEVAFFLCLAETYNNQVLANTLRVLQEAMRSTLRFARERRITGLSTIRAVFDAVAAGNPPRARDAVYAYGTHLLRQFETERGDTAEAGADTHTQRQSPGLS